MNLKTAISTVLNTIDTDTASDVQVRTEGGDMDIDPPEVILSIGTSSLPTHNGANSHGGFTTDGSGNQTGREYHNYRRLSIDCLIRADDEVEGYNIGAAIQDAFIPYEYDATDFNADTAEWDVGAVSVRNNPVVEPDWYELGVVLDFTMLTRLTESGDTLDTIQTEDYNDYIDTSLEDGDVSVGN